MLPEHRENVRVFIFHSESKPMDHKGNMVLEIRVKEIYSRSSLVCRDLWQVHKASYNNNNQLLSSL